MDVLGSLAWAQKTRGLMSARDKLKFIQWAILSEFKSRMAKRKTALKFDEVSWPDAKIVSEIWAECAQLYSAPMLGHVMRTYWWGAALALDDGKKVDGETLALASILHDLGLCEAHLGKASCQCFAYTGACVAEPILTKHQVPEKQRAMVLAGIVAHANPWLPEDRFDPESIYLSRGAFLDVTGTRSKLLDREYIEKVHRQYPRAGFLREILAAMQAPHHPSSRAGFINKAFQKMLRDNPLNQWEA